MKSKVSPQGRRKGSDHEVAALSFLGEAYVFRSQGKGREVANMYDALTVPQALCYVYSELTIP